MKQQDARGEDSGICSGVTSGGGFGFRGPDLGDDSGVGSGGCFGGWDDRGKDSGGGSRGEDIGVCVAGVGSGVARFWPSWSCMVRSQNQTSRI